MHVTDEKTPNTLGKCTQGTAVNIDLNILSCCASDSNIPKMSASVSLGFPNRRKQTKGQGHRMSAFIVSSVWKP